MTTIFKIEIKCDLCGRKVTQSAPFPVGADAFLYKKRLTVAGWEFPEGDTAWCSDCIKKAIAEAEQEGSR